MSKRRIIQIDEKLCNGCGHCVSSCSQGAIAIVNGKAKLVSEHYCDGLGVCVGHCPTGALTIVEKEAVAYQQSIHPINACSSKQADKIKNGSLNNWPIQMALVTPNAPFLDQADLLIAADCTAFAIANFHQAVLKDKIVLIGCPKLDNTEVYIKKLTQIFNLHTFKSITVVRMLVPCCKKLTMLIELALRTSTQQATLREVSIDKVLI